MSTEPGERKPPDQEETLAKNATASADSGATPDAVVLSAAVPAQSAAGNDPPADADAAPVAKATLVRRGVNWAKKHRFTTGGIVSTVVSAIVIALLQPWVQQVNNKVYGAPSPAVAAHAFTITVAYGSPLKAPGAMALPTSAIAQLPGVLPDWSEEPPGPITQGILAKGPAELGENEFLITLQNPAGQDTVDLEGISAKILQTTAPYSGALFRFPSQGSGPTPEVAIDLDSADPYARTWDATSHMLGQNYFLDGNFIDVSGGDSQSVEVFAFAKRAAYAYDVQATVVQDGRTWTMTLTADNHGTPFRVTGAADSYTEVYIDQNLDSSSGEGLSLTQIPWSRCTSAYRSACLPFVEPFSINITAQ